MNIVTKHDAVPAIATPLASIDRVYWMGCAFLVSMLASSGAFAAGTDTGSSSMSSIQTWFMTWIPIAAAILIVVCAVAWIAHMIQAAFAARVVIGLILAGSASYLVGLFGLS